MKTKTARVILAAAVVFCLLLSGCGVPATQSTPAVSTAQEQELLSGVWVAELTIKDYGKIVFEMDAAVAPITVTNFVKLAQSGFYDGLTFHRIISGFMMQGGDPTGTGSGGAPDRIKGEFAANGVDNPQSHIRGAVSMARSQSMDSASSQFFIVHSDSTFLDGSYACFGYVTEGMEVVDAVCESTPVVDNNGTVLPDNRPVIESLTVHEK